MATTVSYSLEVQVVAVDLTTFKLRQDWVTLRTASVMADLVTLAETVVVPDGMLRLKKITTTNDQVVEYLGLPGNPEG